MKWLTLCVYNRWAELLDRFCISQVIVSLKIVEQALWNKSPLIEETWYGNRNPGLTLIEHCCKTTAELQRRIAPFRTTFQPWGGFIDFAAIPLGFGRVSQAVLIKMKFRALTIGGRRPVKWIRSVDLGKGYPMVGDHRTCTRFNKGAWTISHVCCVHSIGCWWHCGPNGNIRNEVGLLI